MARIEAAVASGGGVVYDGRAAKIVGFGDGTVKLRFADGDTLNVALTVFVLNARVSKEPYSPAPTAPWEPVGQRARRVRGMLNGYTRGRRAALHELGRPISTLTGGTRSVEDVDGAGRHERDGHQ